MIPEKLSQLCATGFGLGLLKPMPGTWGSLMGIPIAYGLQGLPFLTVGLLYGMMLVIAYWSADQYGKHLNDSDHSSIVCDEIVGIIPMLWYVPFGIHWIWVFLLFRALDILKPWPICWVDKNVPGAMGCLLDDLLAGLLGWGLAALLLYG